MLKPCAKAQEDCYATFTLAAASAAADATIDRTAAMAIDNLDMHVYIYVYVGPHTHKKEMQIIYNIASTCGNGSESLLLSASVAYSGQGIVR